MEGERYERVAASIERCAAERFKYVGRQFVKASVIAEAPVAAEHPQPAVDDATDFHAAEAARRSQCGHKNQGRVPPKFGTVIARAIRSQQA